MRRKAIIGILISAVFLYLALRKVEWSELVTVLRGAQWWWLAAYVVSAVALMRLRAWRWMLILRPIGTIPFARVYASTMIGFMANNVLPARLGEIARAVSLGIKTGVSRSAALATIIVERIYDSFTLLIFLWLVLTFFSRTSTLSEYGYIRKIGWIFLVINIALVGILVFIQLRNEIAVRWISKLTKRLFKRAEGVAGDITAKFARGLTIHHDLPTTAGVISSSLLLWFLLGASNYLVFLSLGFGHLPLEASFVVLVVVSLMISVPASPGFVGVFHWAVQISLKLYGLNDTQAVAVAILMHAGQYIPITLVGFYHLRHEHLKLSGSGEATPDIAGSAHTV